MKKFKIGLSTLLLVLVCCLMHKFLLLLNYLLALTMHELAHIFVATKRGYKIKFVKLSMFGFSIDMDTEIFSKDSFAINISGPLCNLILAVLCLACYTIVPASYNILNNFCFANLVLSFFNLLPIHPLDGGKIFKNIFKTEKAYKRADTIVRFIFAGLFLILFICSFKHNINWLCLLFVAFFIFSKPNIKPNLSLFKPKKDNRYEKVEMIKVNGTENLFNLLKLINSKHYTLFYCATTRQKYIDEDQVVSLALHFPLDTQIVNLNI